MPNCCSRRQLLAQSSLPLGQQSGLRIFQRDDDACGHSSGRNSRQTAGQTPASVNVICPYAQGVHKGCTPDSPASSAVLPRGVARQGVADRFWAFKGRVSHLCEKPGKPSGQKDTLGGRILWILSVPPPFPLHTSSILPLCQNCARSGYPPDKPGGLLVHGGSEGDLYTKSSAGVARYTCFRRRRCPPKSCG